MDFSDIPSPSAIVARMADQDAATKNPETLGALRELLGSGVPMARAANALDLQLSTAWRIVVADKECQKALTTGDEIRQRLAREKLESQADEMLSVIVSLARDSDEDGAVRLKAAESILDRSGLYDKPQVAKKGNVGEVATAVIELASVDPTFHDRLPRITVTSATRSDD